MSGPPSEQERCRRCDCAVARHAYEKNGITYCCEQCAERYACECGCAAYETPYDSG